MDTEPGVDSTVRAVTAGKVIFTITAIVLFRLFFPHPAWALQADEFRHLSIEELLAMDVTTVSRIPTTTATAPAAVYVITQEEIRRSGALTLPDALRLAPGIQVAQIDANRWAIGIRGFPDRLARSMLVLIDGRAVYSPLFAGT